MQVFDFDKTLIDRDTLFGFYRFVSSKDPSFSFKRIILRVAAVFYKMGMLSNDDLKALGIRLFLKGKTRESIEQAGKEYAQTLSLNEIYTAFYKDLDSGQKMVVSASFEEYLKFVFPQELVLGSRLSYKDGRVKGLALNMYGPNKRQALKEAGVLKVDQFFTDSYVDRPLMEIAAIVYLIKNGKVSIIKEPIESNGS